MRFWPTADDRCAIRERSLHLGKPCFELLSKRPAGAKNSSDHLRPGIAARRQPRGEEKPFDVATERRRMMAAIAPRPAAASASEAGSGTTTVSTPVD